MEGSIGRGLALLFAFPWFVFPPSLPSPFASFCLFSGSPSASEPLTLLAISLTLFSSSFSPQWFEFTLQPPSPSLEAYNSLHLVSTTRKEHPRGFVISQLVLASTYCRSYLVSHVSLPHGIVS
ncbi:hypothetical protein BDY24DRAFT_197241 [Mrakia frigida]|uniref:uncharacterized protein n=1 Tax=Mrakia frigida TaxID=29902 RepID=UPI003FCBFEEF